MSKRTKIVCTLGPAVDSEEALRGLIEAGMDVARLNFSHGSHAEHKVRIDRLKKSARRDGLAVRHHARHVRSRNPHWPPGGREGRFG